MEGYTCFTVQQGPVGWCGYRYHYELAGFQVDKDLELR